MQSSSSSTSSPVHVADMNRDLNHFLTLYSNFRNALGPCYRYEEEEWRWCWSNVDTMTQVVHSIDALLDCISIDISQHRLVKESVADIFVTLTNILHHENEVVEKLASNVMAKMVNNIPSSVFETLVSDVVNLVSSSLPSCTVSDITSFAIKLNWILDYLNPERETLVWKFLEEKKTVDNIINHICYGGIKSVMFFQETINLLIRILRRWPSSRFCVWNNSVLMNVLYTLSLEPYDSLKDAVLQLYSAIALCNNGAKKLLDSGNHSLQLMVTCMDGSKPDYLKLAGFKLAECFVVSEEGRTKMIGSYPEPLVKAIVNELSNWSLYSENPTADQMSLIKGACCVSKIICWPGLHHVYSWELGIESVLLRLLLPDSRIPRQFPSSEELLTMARAIHELKPHVWDILGGLAANISQKFDAKMLKSKLNLKILIACACIGFVDSLCSACENRENDVNEPVCRAVLLMIYSPSKYIVSEVKSILTKKLVPNARKYIRFLLNSLKETVSRKLQVIKLIGLVCYSGLPTYRIYVRDKDGITLLLSYIEELNRNRHNIKPLQMNTNTSLYFCDHNKNMCCYECEEDWVGDEFMFFSLLGLAELIRLFWTWYASYIFSSFGESREAQLKTIMQDICSNNSASGPRWYAAYILSYFGVYGFPSKIGNRIGTGINPEEVKVDGLVVTIRCRQLQFGIDKVDKKALQKLLEYVYSGYLSSENQDLVKSLNQLATKYCLSDLSQILGRSRRSRPIWGTPFPKFDLTSARVLNSRHLWDIVLVAKRNTLVGWKCESCSLSQPHLHAHKAILCPSCVYIRTKLRYGMQESGMDCIEADIGWEALVRLVNWFYSGEIVPRPKYGCLWRNLDENEKIEQMIPYVELYCLSDFWLLKDLHQECKIVISTCLDSEDIALKVTEVAADRLRFAAFGLYEYIADL